MRQEMRHRRIAVSIETVGAAAADIRRDLRHALGDLDQAMIADHVVVARQRGVLVLDGRLQFREGVE